MDARETGQKKTPLFAPPQKARARYIPGGRKKTEAKATHSINPVMSAAAFGAVQTLDVIGYDGGANASPLARAPHR